MSKSLLIYSKVVKRCLDPNCRKILRHWCRSGFCNKCRNKKYNRKIADENLRKLGVLKFRICDDCHEFFYSDKNRSKICQNCSKSRKRKENLYAVTFIKSEIPNKAWSIKSAIRVT